MNFDDSDDKDISASIALTSSQAELLRLLDKLVSLTALNEMINIQTLLKICIKLFIKVYVRILS